MRLPLNLYKLVLMFWPLFALMALGVALNPGAWAHLAPWETALIASPLLLFALAFAFRDRWFLELTPDALVHHTLGRAERFEWARMGEVELRVQTILHLPLARTYWFTYRPEGPAANLREKLGRRLLDVFGDRSGPETAAMIAEWRRGWTTPVDPFG